jgi:carbamoyl-phosphate synthase large subunit
MNLLFSCIGRRGYIVDFFRAVLEPEDRIIGTSNSPWTSGFSSCDLGVVLPDIKSPNYIPSVLRLCREQEVNALYSFFDLDISALSRHRRDFAALGVVPIIPSAEASDICFDKQRTCLFLQENGFHAPQTFSSLAEAGEAIRSGHLGFPLVIKPRHGYASKNLFWARNPKELEVFFHYVPGMLVQESLSGQEYHLDICTDLHGRVLAAVPKRKVSMRAGETDQAQVCDAPELMDFALRLGSALGEHGHVGPLDVDLFVDEDRIVVLELNPRFGGGYPLAHFSGADFPRLTLKMIRGESIDPQIGRFKSGVVMMKQYKLLMGEPDAFFGSIVNMREK